MAVVIEEITARVVTPGEKEPKAEEHKSGGSSPAELGRNLEETLALRAERLARVRAD